MASRRLAQSVVVTFSLVELGCTGSVEHPKPPSDDAKAGGDDEAAEAEAGGDVEVADDGKDDGTAVEPPPDPTAITPTVTVTRRPDGTCWEMVSVTCPPQMACNPPPPRQVDCPPDSDASLPEPSVAANVHVRPDGSCWESFSVTCPAGAMCNPPPPRQVRCSSPTPTP
jgi:hypothetical protein